VDMTVAQWCEALSALRDEDIKLAAAGDDPEQALIEAWRAAPRANGVTGLLKKIGLLRG